MDKEDKTWWKNILKNQRDEIDEITQNFETFFKENQDVTVDQLQGFVKNQAKMAKSGQVRKGLEKRLNAIEAMKGQNLTGEDLKEELNELSSRFHDDLNILSDTVTKGNQLLSSGFQKISGVFRESFGPVFELWDTGISFLGGIYSGIMGVFQFMKTIPALFRTLWGSLTGKRIEKNQLNETKEQTSILESIFGIFKRQEKREMRQGGVEKQGIFSQILKGMGLLVVGVVGTFAMLAENVKGDFLRAYSRIWKMLKGALFSPVRWLTRTIGRTKLGEFLFTKIKGVFTSVGNIFKSIGASVRSTRIGSGVVSIFSKISGFFKGLMKPGTSILNFIQGILKNSGPITKIFGKVATIITKIGGFLGKLIMPVMMIYEVIKGLLDEGSIRDKILSVSAGILSTITSIPQMIINGLLSLFDIDFRVDFGKEAIIGAVNKITDWIYKWITEPVLDFILIDLPNFFKTIPEKIKGLWNTLKEKFMGFISILSDLFTKMKDIFMKYTPIGWAIDGVKKVIGFFTGREEGEDNTFDWLINKIGGLKNLFMKYSPIGWAITGIQKISDYLMGGEDGEDQNIFSKLVEKMKKLPGEIWNWAKDLIPSISDLTEGVKGLGGKALDTAKSIWPFGGGDKKETPESTGAQTGGIVKKGGLVTAHPAEIIVPQNLSEKIGKLINSGNIDSINKTDMERKQFQLDFKNIISELKRMQDKQINNIIEQMKKREKEESQSVQVIGGKGEPPDEIESLSLLVYNKSWGLG